MADKERLPDSLSERALASSASSILVKSVLPVSATADICPAFVGKRSAADGHYGYARILIADSDSLTGTTATFLTNQTYAT